MKPLPLYRNFWPLWLSCAGKPQKIAAIQRTWGIRSNYLYHAEKGLGKPLFQAMAEKGFLTVNDRLVDAGFDWIPAYVVERHPLGGDAPLSAAVVEHWPKIQRFLVKHRAELFGLDKMTLLYPRLESAIRFGGLIFDHLFLFILWGNLTPILQKHRAEVVQRILATFFSALPDQNLLGYYRAIHPFTKALDFPLLFRTEAELLHTLVPFLPSRSASEK